LWTFFNSSYHSTYPNIILLTLWTFFNSSYHSTYPNIILCLHCGHSSTLYTTLLILTLYYAYIVDILQLCIPLYLFKHYTMLTLWTFLNSLYHSTYPNIILCLYCGHSSSLHTTLLILTLFCLHCGHSSTLYTTLLILTLYYACVFSSSHLRILYFLSDVIQKYN